MGDLMNVTELREWFVRNGEPLTLYSGLALLVAGSLVWWLKLRRDKKRVGTAAWDGRRSARWAKRLRSVVMPLILAWEGQGVYLLAVNKAHVEQHIALPATIFTAAILMMFAAYADQHYRQHGNLGPNGRTMWYVAVPMGAIVAFAATSPAETFLRLFLPVLAVLAYRAEYVQPEPTTEGQQSPARLRTGRWRWTPRRVGVVLGLLDPTDADLNQVHAEQLVRRLVSLHRKQTSGPKPLRDWRKRRLQKAAELAQPEHVQEAQRRLQRSRTIVARLGTDLHEQELANSQPTVSQQFGDLDSGQPTPGQQVSQHTADSQPTVARPRPRRALDPTEEQDRAAARALYTESVRNLVPLSEERLGAQFSRGRSWGRARIQESRGEYVTSEYPMYGTAGAAAGADAE